jgi:hypothetical protein
MVGDNPVLDIAGGHAAGLRTIWLQRAGCGVHRIRADRVLHEALTAGPDTLHLALVFGISHNTVARYGAVAEQPLGNELEHLPAE